MLTLGKMLLIFLAIVATQTSVGIALASDSNTWQQRSEETRRLMNKMDEIINSPDDEKAYPEYMKIFSPDIKAHGLTPEGSADLEEVKQHYKPVFEFFDNGVLVSEEVIVAGEMAAQRYHSLFTLNGIFDGVEIEDKVMAIRGITFFRFDENQQIIERWSNHDHAYRMVQLMGVDGERKGSELRKLLNGPGLDEQEVYDLIEEMFKSFNQIHDPQLRATQFFSVFDSSIVVHGLTEETGNFDTLKQYYQDLWLAIPDLVLAVGSKMSAWSMAAVRWKGAGSHRGGYLGSEASWKPITRNGELIVRFNSNGKAEEIWVGSD